MNHIFYGSLNRAEVFRKQEFGIVGIGVFPFALAADFFQQVGIKQAAVPEHPFHIFAAGEKYGVQTNPRDAFGIFFGKKKCQGGAPRTAGHRNRFADVQIFQQAVGIFNQAFGVVQGNDVFGFGASAAALVKHDNALLFQVKIVSVAVFTAAAGTTVKKQNRLAFGVSHLLVIYFMPFKFGQISFVENFIVEKSEHYFPF